jgi:DivIVA domain-containing protein
MAEFSPDDITQQTFRTSFRGFDPNDVRSYLESLAAAVAGLVRERDQMASKLAELGERDLKTEFESIGREVSAVLEAARDAADQLRQRAASDATRWRSEAVAEAEQELRRARADAERLRGDAWATADDLLRQVVAEAERIEARTEKERLRMVGEAEREAHRVVAAGRREAEDMIRTAKVESDRLTVNAQTAHDDLIARANRQADAAQERTRALEIRRQELKAELDSIRHALATAEGELEERRSALQLSPQSPAPAARATEPSAPPVAPEQAPDVKQEGEWTPGETVRVVRPGVPGPGMRTTVSGPMSETPEIVLLTPEEVRARRETGEPGSDEGADTGDGESVDESFREPVRPSDEIGEAPSAPDQDVEQAVAGQAGPEQLEAEGIGAASDAEIDAESPLEPSPPEPTVGEQEPEDRAEQEPEDRAEQMDEPTSEAQEEVVDHDTGRFEELSGLFARLREPSVEPSAPKERSEAAVADLQPEPAPEPKRPVAAYQGDPFELRARLLLPVSNRALRNIKRQLTEAQNEALEELRLSEGDWEPDGPALGTRLRPDLVVLSAESFSAGHAAAMEMSGERFKRPSTPKTEPEVDWIAGLLGDLSHALGEGRRQGQGARQLGASVSRVFRAWRTDEAERRVTELASSRYHVGLSEVLMENGFSTMWVVSGRGCTTCRTNAESVPGDWVSLPPAHGNCDCTLTLV